MTSETSDGTGELPFDLATYKVIEYSNSPEGLKRLQEGIRGRITKSGGRRLVGPVIDVLESRWAMNRVLNYCFYGIALGGLIGLLSSVPTAVMGRGFIWEWHEAGRFARTLFEGGAAGIYVGGLTLAAFAAMYNYHDRRRKPDWNRASFCIATTVASVLGGTLES